MINLMLMMDSKVRYSSYLATGLIIFTLATFTAVVQLPIVKIIIGTGFAFCVFISVSNKKHHYPLIIASLFFSTLAIVVELFLDGGDRNAYRNHFYYILASLCLILGILKEYFKLYFSEKKGGPPKPPCE